MELAVEVGSGAMIFIPSFTKIGFGHSKCVGGGITDTQHGDCISLLSFFQNKDN
jgi:cystathionine beta-lyase/cystathionine gamma-synthase